MPKKLLLFDFDGTIADSLPPVLKIVNKFGPAYGIGPISQADLKILKGMTPKEVMTHFKIPLLKIPFFLNKIRSELLKQAPDIEIFTGMKSALTRLKKMGFELIIVTSSPKENVVKFLDAHELHIFEDVYSNKNVFAKSASLQSILDKRNLPPFEALYIGDEVRDIRACKEVGIPIVCVTWGFNNAEILMKNKPDEIVNTPEELVNVIEKLS